MKELQRELEKAAKSKKDSSKKTKSSPQLTQHQKWRVTKFGHESGIKQMKKETTSTIEQAFATIDMLLDETHHTLWNQVLVKICHTAGWKNEKGEEQTKPRGLSWETFQLWQNEYLLYVFKKDAAEQMCIYLTFHVKKPMQVSVHVCMQRLK